MTITEATNKLVYEMVILTGHTEDTEIYHQYIRMAILVGMEHFINYKDDIIAMDKFGVIVGRYKDAVEASAKLNIPRQNINKVLWGKSHSAGNLIFVRQKDWH